MKCISPPELDDSDLLRYVDGEADRFVLDHLGRCEYCRGRAQEIARIHNRLSARLFRLTCPSPLELGEYHLDLLDRTRADAIEPHLRECPHCSREVAQLRSYLAELAPTVEFSPVERVKVLIANLAGGGRGEESRLQSAFMPAFAGIRGEQEAPSIYEFDGGQVAIEVQDDVEQPDRKVILGLITGLDTRGFAAHLWQGGQRVASVSVDESGNFAIAHLTPGNYELILSSAEVEVHIQTVQI